MHQDQRIGLALGVLLLGAAGAFFFRNDAKPGIGTQRLRTGSQLDARIAEKSVTPYLQGLEEVNPSKRKAERSKSDQPSPPLNDRGNSSRPSSDLSAFFTENSREPFDASNRKSGVIAQSESGGDRSPDLAPVPIPDIDEIATDGARSRDNSSIGPMASERIHIVQKDETLSSIAKKRLGNTNRFIEIYEANRDQLKDPNNLTQGMELRLPEHQVTIRAKILPVKIKSDLMSDAAPPLLEPNNAMLDGGEPSSLINDPQRDGTRNSPPNAVPSDTNKKSVPAKRPSENRATGPQTDARDPKNLVGRRLSQRPPEDSGGKVAR